MYTVYGMTGSCSMAVHVILNELDVPFEVIDVRAAEGQPRPADFLKVNPRGTVPVLVDGELVVREGAAIITYLLEKHKSPLLPESGAARARAQEWLAFANSTMHPAYGRVFFLLGAVKDAAEKESLVGIAIDKINGLWKDVDTQLGRTTYITGNEISGADILLSVIANWLQSNYGSRIIFGENTKRLIKAVVARPAYQKTLSDEKVQYNAAA